VAYLLYHILGKSLFGTLAVIVLKRGMGLFFLFVCFSQDSGGPLLGSDPTYLSRRIIKICLWTALIPCVFKRLEHFRVKQIADLKALAA
jgi:hypothetical protein